jgi:hypothetical protein
VKLKSSAKTALILLLANMTAGCDKLGSGGQTAAMDDGAPDEQQLRKISYMTSDNTGPKGRKNYSHLSEARNCGDFELAMRWNRPPNVAGGPFQKKLVYLTRQLPSDLPKDTEVFITARIERGEMLPAGGAGWVLRMRDGSHLQAVETTNFWEKQEQDSQQTKAAAIVKPMKPGRAFCGHGVYQGKVSKQAGQEATVPLVSLLFSMDRDK